MSTKSISNSNVFCELIANEVVTGYGLIPFVGSGLSKQSGILTGQEFTDFLAYSVYSCVDNSKAWSLRKDGWPKYPTTEDMKHVREWFLEKFAKACERVGISALYDKERLGDVLGFSSLGGMGIGTLSSFLRALSRPPVPELLNTSYTWKDDKDLVGLLGQWGKRPSEFFLDRRYSHNSQEFVEEFAIRCCHDWRSTLDFLARVHRNQAGVIAIDDEPDPSVFDSFNVHITRDRQPNLGHKMLAHLSRTLRTRVVLTTNFDPLTEIAFRRVARPLKEFSVSTQGSLPSEQIVFSTDSIIKLHGSLMETRADFSLDDMPSNADLKRFSNYVLGCNSHEKGGARFRRNHLLVVGYSASDLRCVQMMKHLLEQDHHTKLYWICFSADDEKRLNNIFPESQYNDRIVCHQNSTPDLLLYELYQRLCIGLPSGGVSYQYTARCPALPSSSKSSAKTRKKFEEYAKGVEANPRKKMKAIDRFAIVPNDDRREFFSYQLSQFLTESVKRRTSIPLNAKLYDTEFRISRLRFDRNEKVQDVESGQPAIICVQQRSGSVSAAGQFISSCGAKLRKQTVFLELQDNPNARSVLRELLISIALERGVFQTELVNFLPRYSWPEIEKGESDAKALGKLTEHISDLFKQMGTQQTDWVVCLYARSGYGTCSSWGEKYTGWSEPDTALEPDTELEPGMELRLLWIVMDILTEIGVQVVYFPLSQSRFISDQAKSEILLGENLDYFRENETEESIFPFDSTKGFQNWDGVFEQTNTSELVAKSKHKTYRQRIQVISRLLDQYEKATNVEDVKGLQVALNLKEQLHWIYAATLMRHSRHVSALFSDATLRAPSPFNLNGIDNDLRRLNLSNAWVKELVAQGIFLEKTGGFYWMHRDLRLSIQKALECKHLKKIKFSKTFKAGNGTVFREFPQLIEKRSSLHRTIAEWYLKAFLTSRNWIPAIESMYHFRMAAVNAKNATTGVWVVNRVRKRVPPSELLAHRFQLLHSSLNELLKLIDLSKDFIQFWMADSKGYPMFDASAFKTGDVNPFDLKKFEINVPNSQGPLKAQTENLISRVKKSLEGLNSHIKNERIVAMQRTVSLAKALPIVNSKGATKVIKEMLSHETTIPVGDIEYDKPSWLARQTHQQRKNGSLSWMSFLKDLDADWVIQIHKKVLGNSEVEGIKLDKFARVSRAKWAAEHSNNPCSVLTLLEALGEFAYEHLQRTNLERDLEAASGKDNSNRIQRLRLVVAAISLTGLSLCRHLDPVFSDREAILRAKFSTFHGLALGHLGRFYEAHRRLTDAKQYLAKVTGNEQIPLQISVIRLRRTEVYIEQAKYIMNLVRQRGSGVFDEAASESTNYQNKWNKWVSEKSHEMPDTPKDTREIFNEQVLEWLAIGGEQNDINDPQRFTFENELKCSIRTLLKNNPNDKLPGGHLLRAAWGAIDDAATTLELAERQLSNNSQHSLWWGRVYTLKMELFHLDREFQQLFDRLWCGQPVNDAVKSYLKRKPFDYPDAIQETLDKGILATEHSPARQLRILRHYLNTAPIEAPAAKQDVLNRIYKIELNISKESKLTKQIFEAMKITTEKH